MQQGTIARKTDRGFGFISIPGQEKDLFFHSNSLEGVSFDELNEGDKVQFEVEQGPKGPNATKISLVSGDASTEESSEAPASAEESDDDDSKDDSEEESSETPASAEESDDDDSKDDSEEKAA